MTKILFIIALTFTAGAHAEYRQIKAEESMCLEQAANALLEKYSPEYEDLHLFRDQDGIPYRLRDIVTMRTYDLSYLAIVAPGVEFISFRGNGLLFNAWAKRITNRFCKIIELRKTEDDGGP